MIKFAWDPHKERLNRNKHGVSFEEARSVFLDDRALLIGDPEHSSFEDRYILLGISLLGRLIRVHHMYRQNDEIIRIISALKATKREIAQYTKVNL